jgi:hypothetical protein
VSNELEEESIKKWQSKWSQTTKGSTTKEYFPNIKRKIKNENKSHTKPHGYTNGTWKKQKHTYIASKL